MKNRQECPCHVALDSAELLDQNFSDEASFQSAARPAEQTSAVKPPRPDGGNPRAFAG